MKVQWNLGEGNPGGPLPKATVLTILANPPYVLRECDCTILTYSLQEDSILRLNEALNPVSKINKASKIISKAVTEIAKDDKKLKISTLMYLHVTISTRILHVFVHVHTGLRSKDPLD